MLYRRFMLLTSVIALIAIAFINIVQATTAPHRDFAVSERLKQWELHQQRRTCSRDDRLCHNEVLVLNKV